MASYRQDLCTSMIITGMGIESGMDAEPAAALFIGLQAAWAAMLHYYCFITASLLLRWIQVRGPWVGARENSLPRAARR